jgi:acylaminoacyl-peptidase
MQFVFYEDWGEALVGKSCPVLCVLDIEGNNVSLLDGVPEDISPGQVHLLQF